MYRLSTPTILISLIGIGVLAFVSLAAADEANFRLSDQCPPSFSLEPDGGCDLRSLYQLYAEPGKKFGAPADYGGVRAPLPRHRGGYRPEVIDLGRLLFFDPVLSGDRTLSCAHCHHPDHGFADGRGRSIGKGGRDHGPSRTGGAVLDRGAPTLWNIGFMDRLFLDARAGSLEEQAIAVLTSPEEMHNSPQLLEETLSDIPAYQSLFQQAFGDESNRVTIEQVAVALSAFQSSLVSLSSRYDRYVHGDHDALTQQEQTGHNWFRSFLTRCTQCHTPPLFTNQVMAVVGAPEPVDAVFDQGAQGVTSSEHDRGAFRVPSLRNIEATAPYMHSGGLDTLQDVVEFYNEGVGNVAPDDNLHFHWHVPVELNLKADVIVAMVAFMKTLTDESFKPVIPEVVPSGLPIVEVSPSKDW